MPKPSSKILQQIVIYTEQINYWEHLIKTNTYKAGEYDLTTSYIKKNWLIIDSLLDQYNSEKNLASCP